MFKKELFKYVADGKLDTIRKSSMDLKLQIFVFRKNIIARSTFSNYILIVQTNNNFLSVIPIQ
jgi:hypothetical protein